MGHKYSFEKLEVWEDSNALVVAIYSVIRDFPDTEKYGLANQMRRAAISVISNIAEGSARTSLKEQAHFYQIAYSSLFELLAQLIIAHRLGFTNNGQLNNLRGQIENISMKLNGLRKSCLRI